MSPEMTGDTASGTSMSATRSALPGKSNFPIAHPAARPNAAFEGSSAFLLGSVLQHFFARYVSLNSFTETVVRSQQRGEIIRWKPQVGRRQLI